MARRRKKDDGSEALAWILTGIFLVGFFLIKWTIEAIVFVIKLIIDGSRNKKIKTSNKETQTKINEIATNSFANSTIKPIENVEKKDIKEKLNLFDKNMYDDLFEIQIRRRGETYYSEKKIRNVKQEGNLYTCQADGTDVYDVSLEFDSNNKIIHSSCTCPYYMDKKKNCKHIYALLINAKCEENLVKILDEISKYSNNLSDMIEKTNKVIKESATSIDEEDRYRYINTIDNYNKRYEKYAIEVDKYKYNEESLLRILENLIEDGAKWQELLKNIMTSAANSSSKKSTTAMDYITRKDRVTLGDVATGLFVANEVDKHLHKEDEDYDEELEKEMDVYNLEEWERELVRNGEYNPWNFEEPGGVDPLDEDDYYYDEDDYHDDE